jgi:hypothetical protein
LPLAVHVSGQAAKRGLIPRVPPADRLLADIEAWLGTEYPDIVRSSRRRELPSGAAELWVSLHPAAEEATFSAADAGEVTLAAVTAAVGPGYHTFVGRMAQRLGSDLSIVWSEDRAEAPVADSPALAPTPSRLFNGAADDAARPVFGDRPTIERAHLARLEATVAAVRDAYLRGSRNIHVDTQPGVRYAFDGVLATPLGPRSAGWLEAAVGDPRVAVDISPWWADATDARYLLNRALCLMWTEVRWRPAADPAEKAVLDEVARLLSRAHPLGPSLPFPWREWAELLDLRGVDEPAAGDIREHAATTADDRPLIGYRRRPVTISHEGWTLEIPGSFGERRSPEEFWGGAGGRSITLAAVETGTAGGPMSAEGFLHQVASHLGSEALSHQAGEVIGQARLGTDASSGIEVGVVEGYSAVRGRGAAVRITFDDAADWQWALDTWRGLAPG